MESRGKLKSDPRRSQLLLDPWGLLVWLKGEEERGGKIGFATEFSKGGKKRGGRKVVNGTHPVFLSS